MRIHNFSRHKDGAYHHGGTAGKEDTDKGNRGDSAPGCRHRNPQKSRLVEGGDSFLNLQLNQRRRSDIILL